MPDPIFVEALVAGLREKEIRQVFRKWQNSQWFRVRSDEELVQIIIEQLQQCYSGIDFFNDTKMRGTYYWQGKCHTFNETLRVAPLYRKASDDIHLEFKTCGLAYDRYGASRNVFLKALLEHLGNPHSSNWKKIINGGRSNSGTFSRQKPAATGGRKRARAGRYGLPGKILNILKKWKLKPATVGWDIINTTFKQIMLPLQSTNPPSNSGERADRFRNEFASLKAHMDFFRKRDTPPTAIRQGDRAQMAFETLKPEEFTPMTAADLPVAAVAAYRSHCETALGSPQLKNNLRRVAQRLMDAGVQVERDGIMLDETIRAIVGKKEAILQAVADLDSSKAPSKMAFADIVFGIKDYFLGHAFKYGRGLFRHLSALENKSLLEEFLVHEALHAPDVGLTHEQIRLVTALVYETANYPAGKDEGLLREEIDRFVRQERARTTQWLNAGLTNYYAAAQAWAFYAAGGIDVVTAQDMDSLFCADGVTVDKTKQQQLVSWLEFLTQSPERATAHPFALYSLGTEMFPMERLSAIVGEPLACKAKDLNLLAAASNAANLNDILAKPAGRPLRVLTLNPRPWKQAGLEAVLCPGVFHPRGPLAGWMSKQGLERFTTGNGFELWDPVGKPGDINGRLMTYTLAQMEIQGQRALHGKDSDEKGAPPTREAVKDKLIGVLTVVLEKGETDPTCDYIATIRQENQRVFGTPAENSLMQDLRNEAWAAVFNDFQAVGIDATKLPAKILYRAIRDKLKGLNYAISFPESTEYTSWINEKAVKDKLISILTEILVREGIDPKCDYGAIAFYESRGLTKEEGRLAQDLFNKARVDTSNDFQAVEVGTNMLPLEILLTAIRDKLKGQNYAKSFFGSVGCLSLIGQKMADIIERRYRRGFFCSPHDDFYLFSLNVMSEDPFLGNERHSLSALHIYQRHYDSIIETAHKLNILEIPDEIFSRALIASFCPERGQDIQQILLAQAPSAIRQGERAQRLKGTASFSANIGIGSDALVGSSM